MDGKPPASLMWQAAWMGNPRPPPAVGFPDWQTAWMESPRPPPAGGVHPLKGVKSLLLTNPRYKTELTPLQGGRGAAHTGNNNLQGGRGAAHTGNNIPQWG